MGGPNTLIRYTGFDNYSHKSESKVTAPVIGLRAGTSKSTDCPSSAEVSYRPRGLGQTLCGPDLPTLGLNADESGHNASGDSKVGYRSRVLGQSWIARVNQILHQFGR